MNASRKHLRINTNIYKLALKNQTNQMLILIFSRSIHENISMPPHQLATLPLYMCNYLLLIKNNNK